MNNSPIRHAHAALVILALAVPPVMAEAPEQKARLALEESVRAGDSVAVTRWSGEKTQGEVLAVSAGALEVLTLTHTVMEIPAATIRTVRRHVPRKPNAAVALMLEIANHCDEAACVPAALVYVGLAGLIDGVDALVDAPKVVYRARHPPVAVPSPSSR